MTAEPLPIVVTGGRRYADPPRGVLAGRVAGALRAALRAHPSGVAVAHGANPASMGGDALCGRACAELRREGLPAQVRGFAVEPGLDGAWPAAGNRRNARMVRAHRPLLAIGFPDPGSRGTWHCLAAAASHRADLLIDLAALPAEVAVSVARRALREYGCELGEVLWVPEGWIARGPLAEAVLEGLIDM